VHTYTTVKLRFLAVAAAMQHQQLAASVTISFCRFFDIVPVVVRSKAGFTVNETMLEHNLSFPIVRILKQKKLKVS